MKIHESFDQHDHFTLSSDMGPVLAEKALLRFRERYPDWNDYNSPANVDLLTGYCFGRAVPITLRNLRIAMLDLIEDGTLRKKDVTLEALNVFMEQCPDWANFASQKNGDAIERYLTERKLEITVPNLFKAFDYCVKTRLIRPVLTGFFKTGAGRITEADRQLSGEEHERASQLSGPGKPVTPELRQAYQASLGQARSKSGATPAQIRDARIAIGNDNPDLDIRSLEFKKKVSDLLSGRQHDGLRK